MERIFLILKPPADARDEILLDLDLDVDLDLDLHSVEADEMLLCPNEHAELLRHISSRMSKHVNVYTKRIVVVRDRQVAEERLETAIVATEAGLNCVPLVIAADSKEAADAMTVTAREGGSVSGTGLTSRNLRVADVSFAKALRVGEGHLVAVDVNYRPVIVPLGTSQHGSAEQTKTVGMHKGGRLAAVVAQFDPNDPPRRCVHTFERKLGAGYEEQGALQPDHRGRAEVVVADPKAGWHGIAWQW